MRGTDSSTAALPRCCRNRRRGAFMAFPHRHRAVALASCRKCPRIRPRACAVGARVGQRRSRRCRYGSLVAIDTLPPLVPLLRLDRERGDGARLEPLERDRLAGLLAIAVGAVVETRERGVDL